MPVTRRRFCLSLSFGAAATACGWAAYSSRSGSRLAPISRTSLALGATVEISVLHPSSREANQAIDAAFLELDHVEDVLSLYRSQSQLCELNRQGVVYKPHPYLLQVLESAQRLAARSEGKFDVTIQPLWKLHDACSRQGRAPTHEELKAACGLVDWRQLEVSPGAVSLGRPGMAVTLNGIAQGFAADQVLAVLKKQGIEQALVNTGELGALGSNPQGRPWCVGIQHPRHEEAYAGLADLDGRCLATSGDYASTFGVSRERHHLLDPDTGESASEFASVSIVAPTGMLADGLSTSVFVLGVEQGVRLIESTPHADLFAILQNGRTVRTPGFPFSDAETGA